MVYLGKAMEENPGYLRLRKIRAAQAIAHTVSHISWGGHVISHVISCVMRHVVMWSVVWPVVWSVVWPVVWSVVWPVVWPVMWWLMWACSNISGRQSVILVLKSFCTAIWLHGGGVWGGGYRDLPGNDFQWFMPDNKRVCFILICGSFPDCPISEPSLPERRHTHAQSERHWNEGRVNLNLYCAFFCMLNLLYIH